MGANLSQEIIDSLRVLGLEPGASASDVRVAFRRLAHVCHPDVAGQEEAQRFQKITGAYAILKGLTTEELENLVLETEEPDEEEEPRQNTFFDWYRRRADDLDEPEDLSEEAQERGRRVDLILEQYDERLSSHLEQLEHNKDESMAGEVLSRLKSSMPEVRRLALERVGAFANRGDVRQALARLLNRWEVDEGTARLVSGLPMNNATRRQLAEEVADHAMVFPNSLLSSLLGLRQPEGTPDLPLMERYLSTASPDGVALILRYWPTGQSPADATLRRLLASDDPQVLVPVLSAMKQHFPKSAPFHKKRLTELQEHPASAVRVWGRVLSSF
ncbi:MAG: J domain-containing protein [Fretibacterium sp.]|nr:J domain-containing protein [Fretibacterium sp.]